MKTQQKKKIDPFKLEVTYRSNLCTTDSWQHLTLGNYFKKIEHDPNIKAKSLKFKNFINGFPDGSEETDYVLELKHFDEPYKSQYRELKLDLPCVNFFGKYLPPHSAMHLEGNGNGIVILDVDYKLLGKKEGLSELLLEWVEDQMLEHFKTNNSIIFYYASASGYGFHIGYLTDATTDEQYRIVYKQLAEELKRECPIFEREGIIDKNVKHSKATFFSNHSSVIKGHPKEIYKGNYEEISIPVAIVENITDEESPFPYNVDFRLYLAYQRRSNKQYFHDRNHWRTMMFGLIAEYPDCFYKRMKYWFTKLSELSPKHVPDKDLAEFDAIVEDYDGERKSGVGFIIKKLNDDEVVTMYPQYDNNDLKNYFNSLGELDFPDTLPSNYIYIENYISKIDDLFQRKGNLIIESPPNSGKSRYFLSTVTFKRIFLVPTKILLSDLRAHAPNALVVEEGVLSSEIYEAHIILSTYEGLEKILNSGIELQEYTVIMDEAHNLFIQSSPTFRFLSMYRILRLFGRFKRAILLSGTWINFAVGTEEFDLIQIRLKNPTKTLMEIVSCIKPLESLTNDTVNEPGKQIILINNKDENNQLKQHLQHPKNNPTDILRPVTLMNSDTKTEIDVKNLLEKNSLNSGEVLIGTQMIVEGISLKDEDIKAIRIYRGMLPELITQLSFRARSTDARPILKYYQSKQEFRLNEEITYQNMYEDLREIAESKNLNNLPRECISTSNILIYKERLLSKTEKLVFLPHIIDPLYGTSTKINSLLLGYLTLEKVKENFSGNLFPLLCHLRKFNCHFSFSNAVETSSRLDFKNLKDGEYRDTLKNNFQSIASAEECALNKRIKDAIYRAYLLTRVIKADYFLNWTPEKREEFFMDKKKCFEFAAVINGHYILSGKKQHISNLLLPLENEHEQSILKTIKTVEGYPDSISNRELKICYPTIKIGTVKKALKRQFNLSESCPAKNEKNESVRVFGMTEKEHDFKPFLIVENLADSDSPF